MGSGRGLLERKEGLFCNKKRHNLISTLVQFYLLIIGDSLFN